MGYCKSCFEKQQINRLTWENEQLKAKVRSQERATKEGPFGSATPSSKVPVKPNALAERQARRGGAKPGHVGHGRARASTRRSRTGWKPSLWRRRPVRTAAWRFEAKAAGSERSSTSGPPKP